MFWKTSTTCLNIYSLPTKLREGNGDTLFWSARWTLHIARSFAHLLRTPLRWQARDVAVAVAMSEMSVTNVLSPVDLLFCSWGGGVPAQGPDHAPSLVILTLSCTSTLNLEIFGGGMGLEWGNGGEGCSPTSTAVVKVIRKVKSIFFRPIIF